MNNSRVRGTIMDDFSLAWRHDDIRRGVRTAKRDYAHHYQCKNPFHFSKIFHVTLLQG